MKCIIIINLLPLLLLLLPLLLPLYLLLPPLPLISTTVDSNWVVVVGYPPSMRR